jgi:hypothetical protein
MLLQAVVLLVSLQAATGWAVPASAVAALIAAVALLRESRCAAPRFGVRVAARGGIEVLELDGTVRVAEALLASPALVVLRIGDGGAARIRSVWRDMLPATEFRRFMTAARWARLPADTRSAV